MNELELLREYLPILIFIVVAAGLSGIMVIASLILARQNPDPEKLSPYECGFEDVFTRLARFRRHVAENGLDPAVVERMIR